MHYRRMYRASKGNGMDRAYRTASRTAIGAHPVPVPAFIPVARVTSPDQVPVPHRVLRSARRGYWKIEVTAQPDWSLAACSGQPEVFDPFFNETSDPTGAATLVMLEKATGLCATCPLLTDCQEWGLAHEEFGMWGGLTTDRRRKIRAARKQSMDPILSQATFLEVRDAE
jgi:hypothetical protein